MWNDLLTYVYMYALHIPIQVSNCNVCAIVWCECGVFVVWLPSLNIAFVDLWIVWCLVNDYKLCLRVVIIHNTYIHLHIFNQYTCCQEEHISNKLHTSYCAMWCAVSVCVVLQTIYGFKCCHQQHPLCCHQPVNQQWQHTAAKLKAVIMNTLQHT